MIFVRPYSQPVRIIFTEEGYAFLAREVVVAIRHCL